ncbi:MULTISPECIES: hypothetical protein [Niastella]|uniref:Rhamnogalacturonan lyase domain-containing protein n=1 Tax=Niastella soli TaxID=2821487 RepID=A0ABS3YV60_9BACT|nr:hypothetical protein [Niastella soli]MBO9201787.1 hypothetical protein [Niastella soli]
MDKTVATFIGVVCAVIGLHATRAMNQSNITGKVSSERDSVWVYAVSGNDSLKTMVSNGQFRFKVRPGSWRVTVTKDHEKNEGVHLVQVTEGRTLDMGTIILN